MPAQPLTCWICHDPLQVAPAGRQLCQKVACRFAYQALPPNRLCGVCRRPLTLPQQPEGTCADAACRAAAGERRLAAAAEEHRVASEQLHQLVRGMAGSEVETGPVTFLPSLRPRMTELPPGRQAVFTGMLDRLLAQLESEEEDVAGAGAEPVAPVSADLLAVAASGCAGCKGSCCTQGQTHAFVTIRTLRRVRAAAPGLTIRQIREAFVSRLGGMTVENSCVFHGDHGCKLPVEIRGDTCNTFFCPGLRGLFEAAPDPVRTVMAWPSEESGFDVALVEPSGARPLGRVHLPGP